MPQADTPGAMAFFGADLNFEACEALAVQRLPAQLLANEADLMHAKWFDYRFWHPVVATYAFAQAYDRAFKKITQLSRDVVRGAYVKGFKGEDIFQGKELAGFWKARQAADAIGCPYDFFCWQVMRWAEERCWTRFPRPNQLYSAEALAHVVLRWGEEQAARLITAEDERYAAASAGSTAQAHYQDYLVRQVKARQQPVFGLHYLLKVKGHLTEPAARRHFGDALVNRALAIELE